MKKILKSNCLSISEAIRYVYGCFDDIVLHLYWQDVGYDFAI